KAIPTILTPDQVKRFRQIMLQIREQPATRVGVTTVPIPSAAAYPGVAEAIKLTPEQKTRMIEGDEPATVLTADQKTVIKEIPGEPNKGPTTTPTPPPVNDPNPRPPTGLLQFPSRTRSLATGAFDEPLKITPQQRVKLEAANADFQEAT